VAPNPYRCCRAHDSSRSSRILDLTPPAFREHALPRGIVPRVRFGCRGLRCTAVFLRFLA
jgi:hypothetical protein